MQGVTPVAQGFLVHYQAHNRGGETLADLQVKATLRRTDGSQEEREAHLDYVPPHSSRNGGLFFESDPRQGRLTLAPGGFQVP
jgi:uncharacterized protein (TIGR02588 family)